MMNLDGSAICGCESARSEPCFEMLKWLAAFFGVDPNYLLGWTDNQHKELSEESFLNLLEDHGKMIYREMMK